MTPYYRLSGGGNDFLALIEPEAVPETEQIRALCSRGLSLGADGLFALRRTAAGAQMDYFNADGRGAALCLNGVRCAGRLAFHLGWGERELEILTGAGAVTARLSDDGEISLEVPAPRGRPSPIDVPVDKETHSGYRIRIGVPYFVLPWQETLARAPVAQLGERLRHAPEVGTTGANVAFVRYPSDHRIEMRVFERGVEAETLASGTGVLAATAVGIYLERTRFPAEVLTRGGHVLAVDGEIEDGRPTQWVLSGDTGCWPKATIATPPNPFRPRPTGRSNRAGC